eukprot:Nitzschia sp. Nitz4//scaffold20_size174350//27134//28802//NITZ4_002083-RA/size174350-augustus-gene-0.44-mRNA-1//-1//CDS//3329541752//8772//frame0
MAFQLVVSLLLVVGYMVVGWLVGWLGDASRGVGWLEHTFTTTFRILLIHPRIPFNQPSSPPSSTTRMSHDTSSSTTTTATTTTTTTTAPDVVLVVGSCGLDRLLTVSEYPAEDAKVRTTTYTEVGGGNAANTAAAMGRLTQASFLQRRVSIQFLGKVGGDSVGQQLLQELQASSVDISSPLCLRGPPGSTTAFTTILVSAKDHTRTCIHTPGTCGELQVEDINRVDLDQVFANVVHLHSDSRHSAASLLLAQHAKRRGITVSIDCEKDRHSPELDALLPLCDYVFTNANYLGAYVERRTREMEQHLSVDSLPAPTFDTSVVDSSSHLMAQSLVPIAFLNRWYYPQNEKRDSSNRRRRQVIVTQGDKGALHYQATSAVVEVGVERQTTDPLNQVVLSPPQQVQSLCSIMHRYNHGTRENPRLHDIQYEVRGVGILQGTTVVDTTGSGDAFIGGYLLTTILPHPDTMLSLRFGSWVAGRKVSGPGARTALPTGAEVDDLLGKDMKTVNSKLSQVLSNFDEQA